MIFGKKPPMQAPDSNGWLRKTDLPEFFEREPAYDLIEVDEESGFPKSLRFKFKHFEQTLTVASLIGNDHDISRGWLTAAFNPDPAVDLAFANSFNRRRRLACATIDENGACHMHSHFPLSGLRKRDAELMLAVYIEGFEKALVELNALRNTRAH